MAPYGRGEMAGKKIVFVAFAGEDEPSRVLFLERKIRSEAPFEFADMAVKEPFDADWQERTRAKIRESDGVVALISPATPDAAGHLWEIGCAVEEGKEIVGIWLEDGYEVRPVELGSAPCKEWTWENVAAFIDSL
jgi:nucleoside 2-deoxyribosyltransferase